MVPAQQLEALIPYVMGEHGAKRGYILAADYNYGHITSKWMQKIIRDNGAPVRRTIVASDPAHPAAAAFLTLASASLDWSLPEFPRPAAATARRAHSR